MEASAGSGTLSPEVFLKKDLLGTQHVQNQNECLLGNLHFWTLILDSFFLFNMEVKQINLRKNNWILNTKGIQKEQGTPETSWDISDLCILQISYHLIFSINLFKLHLKNNSFLIATTLWKPFPESDSNG